MYPLPDYEAVYAALKAAEQATSRPKVILAADSGDVMREQLEALLAHVADGACGCSDCRRYLGVRAILLEPFEETASKPIVLSAAGLARG